MHHRSRRLSFGAVVLAIALVATPTIATASSDRGVAPTPPTTSAGIFVPDKPPTSWQFTPIGTAPGMHPDASFTWGWITGTIYFNRRETRLIAAFGGVAGYLATLIGPWGVLIGAHATTIAATANFASATQRCLKIKIPALSPGIYSGGYCT